MDIRIGVGFDVVLGHFSFAVVSSYPIVVSREELVSAVTFGGGCVLSYRRLSVWG